MFQACRICKKAHHMLISMPDWNLLPLLGVAGIQFLVKINTFIINIISVGNISLIGKHASFKWLLKINKDNFTT